MNIIVVNGVNLGLVFFTLRAGVTVIDANVHRPTLTVRYWNPRVDARKSRVLISTPIRSNVFYDSLHQSLQADTDLRLTFLCGCNENFSEMRTLTTAMLIRASKSMPAPA